MPAAPRALPEHATIGICQPSGALPDPAALPRAVAHLESLGHRVVVAPGIEARSGYFAGPLAQRLASLHGLVADPAIDLIMPARGGFGLSHLLPHIDWAACASSAKLFCGFSDFTAVQLGLCARTGQRSFAGPMAVSDFAGESVSALHASEVWPLLAGTEQQHRYPQCVQSGPPLDTVIEGPLWGGNLSLLAHLVGTPWFPQIEGGILFLEEIAEAPYRVERMLLQLELAGVLARCRAILLGAFTACEPLPGGPVVYTLPEVMAALRARFAGPVLDGLPFGHVRDKLALPFAAPARLTVNGLHWQLQVESILAP